MKGAPDRQPPWFYAHRRQDQGEEVFSKAAWVVATWFGCGFAPKAGHCRVAGGSPPVLARGTVGPRRRGRYRARRHPRRGLGGVVVVRELADEDPQVVVADEVAGTLITMLSMAAWSWRAVVVEVFLFRLFGMVKPWPIRKLERLPGGWGVVMDDVGRRCPRRCSMGILRYVRLLPWAGRGASRRRSGGAMRRACGLCPRYSLALRLPPRHRGRKRPLKACGPPSRTTGGHGCVSVRVSVCAAELRRVGSGGAGQARVGLLRRVGAVA